jgi:hypothetical protein
MTYQEYASIPAVNFSTLKEMARSPRHYRHRLTTPREDTAAMAFGRAVHTAVLEPDEFPKRYVLWDQGRRAGKVWEQFLSANRDKEPLTASEYQTALDVRDAVRGDAVAAPYFSGEGESEVTLRWIDKDTGLDCKARLDRRFPTTGGIGYVVDLKTTRDAGADEFAKTVARLKYVHQMAFYCHGAEAVYGDEHRAVLVAVESDPPHDVCVYEVAPADLATAGDEVAALLQRVKECQESGVWPGRFTEKQRLSVPYWAFEQDDSEFDLTGLGIFKGEK